MADSQQKKYILAIDQGTTGTTAGLVNLQGEWVGSETVSFEQIFPKPSWVEHNLDAIWSSVEEAIVKLFSKLKVSGNEIASIGITNQRETVAAWDSVTGKPLGNAIVWQCRRTTERCEALKKNKKLSKMVRRKTGLVLDPYFSGTKMEWMLKNLKSMKSVVKNQTLRFGTMDSYLIWKLTNGVSHTTEVSNASRTLLINLNTLQWDKELLKIFHIPSFALPKILSSNGNFGVTKGLSFLPEGIPITGVLGDQQAALFGQSCFRDGEAKCTFGTGSFILMNTGGKPSFSKHGLLTTVAWSLSGKAVYALEGGAFICGAAIQWLRDGLKIIQKSSEVEALARSVPDSGGVEFVPALAGLGAPYWDPRARGLISGITRGSTSGHIARATLEAMALQNAAILFAMEKDFGKTLRSIKVDGGATVNELLLQLQSDYLGKKVERPKVIETTAYGAALMAGLGLGLWKSLSDLEKVRKVDKIFSPQMKPTERKNKLSQWNKSIQRTCLH